MVQVADYVKLDDIFINFVVDTLGKTFCVGAKKKTVPLIQNAALENCGQSKCGIKPNRSFNNATKCRKGAFYASHLFLFIEQTMIHNFIHSVWCIWVSAVHPHISNEFNKI